MSFDIKDLNLVVSLNYGYYQYDILQIDYNRVVAYGAKIYFLASLIWLLFGYFSGKKSIKIKYQLNGYYCTLIYL